MEKADLYVEGPDDFHAIVHLLKRHGIDYDTQLPRLPKIGPAGGVEELLAVIETAVLARAGRAVGFILDANGPLSQRWARVTAQLSKAGVDCPERPPADGFVGQSQPHGTRVGVWLMPDNQQDGALENFLMTLVAEDDPLIGHAQASTEAARCLGAEFRDPDLLKAVLHAWLAWQEEPGRPYGSAIQERYFLHESPAANAFVAWFRSLYGIADRALSGPDPSS